MLTNTRWCGVAGLLMLGWMLLVVQPLHAQSHEAAPPSMVEAAASAPPVLIHEAVRAPVVVMNRTVTVFRSSLLGVSAQERARRAEFVLRDWLDRGAAGAPGLRSVPQGRALTLQGEMLFILTPGDVDVPAGETLDRQAREALAMLEQVLQASREGRDRHRLLQGLAVAATATAVFGLLAWGLRRLRAWGQQRLLLWVGRGSARLTLAGTELLQRDRLMRWVAALLRLLSGLLLVLLAYQWLSVVLSQFPYTRPWGERLSEHLWAQVWQLLGGVGRAVPDLLVALLIFALARGATGLLKPVFDRIERAELVLGWLDQDTVRPMRRIVSLGIWLFALVMAYPYLPGSDSEAFKGLSVLLGLMISLGSSSVVGQGASGLILMFSRTLRVGEYVRINDSEGTVTELGMFTTRIRTGLGEELTLPNAMVLGTVTRNYSRAVHGTGYVVDTTVTIGYDTPWRQVEAMLLEAASRTEGVLMAPPPRVFQTALSDFYPEYRLVCQAVPEQPRPRAEVLSRLHANIQDVFNAYGVQIMSPHYLGDPAAPKFVPRSAWFTAPAVQVDGGRNAGEAGATGKNRTCD